MTLDSNTFHWLLLQRLPGLSAAVLRKLARSDPAVTDPEHWLIWPSTRLQALGVDDVALAAIADWRRHGMGCAAAIAAQRDQEWLASCGATLVYLHHPLYPPLLLEIPDPPPCLYVWGDASSLAKPQLAMVGSRRATRQGLADAELFAGALAGAGFIVTSGLAYGIDAASHKAALAANGYTIAVLGSGLDTIYPARHQALAEAISAHGAVVSALPLGSQPLPTHFPSRNRIISGLSLGVLVVEAALQSGSLITARLALEQNREVFAIPGSIHNPASRGCNTLIRRGAILVQEVQDIFDELRGWSQPVHAGIADVPHDLSADAAEVLQAVEYHPTPLDLIADAVLQPLPLVLATLSELELRGLVENCAGSYQRCPR